MNGYSTHWRTTIFAAICLHFFAALGFSYVLPHFESEPKIEDVAEFEWVDADLFPPEVTVIKEEEIPSTSTQETLPTFNAQDLFVPEIKIPEPVISEPPPEVKPIESPKPLPEVKPDRESAKKIQNEEPSQEVVVSPAENQRMSRPPVTLTEFYPEKGSGLGYRGYVSVTVTIGKDGKVKSAQIVQSSGRMFVDEIARKAVMRWTFRPALDQKNKPMVSTKIITFDFKKFSEA